MQERMRMTRWRRAFPRVGQINRWNNERDGERERERERERGREREKGKDRDRETGLKNSE